MLEKRRSGRTSTKTSIEDEIAHLRGLNLKGLRARWQSVLQRPAPAHLPRHLLFAILAYRIQAGRLGDLDHETKQVLDRTSGKAWNGQTYDSLSKVAFAITGTKWNGPRFFGLRDKDDRLATEARP
jgi:hypothetical protein